LGDSGTYDLNDYSMLFDVEFPIYQQLKLNARYAFSLIKIRERQFHPPTDDNNRKQYNRVFSFRILWYFNEEVSRQSRLRGRF